MKDNLAIELIFLVVLINQNDGDLWWKPFVALYAVVIIVAIIKSVWSKHHGPDSHANKD